MNLQNRFTAVRIMVLGDIMLDQYWWGSVERISPEAPVPVVRLNRTSVVPGGAANVAANVGRVYQIEVFFEDKDQPSKLEDFTDRLSTYYELPREAWIVKNGRAELDCGTFA